MIVKFDRLLRKFDKIQFIKLRICGFLFQNYDSYTCRDINSQKLDGRADSVWFGSVWFGSVWFGSVWFGPIQAGSNCQKLLSYTFRTKILALCTLVIIQQGFSSFLLPLLHFKSNCFCWQRKDRII